MMNYSLYVNQFWFFNNEWVPEINFFNNSFDNPFNARFFNELLHNFYLLMDDGDFNKSFDFHWNLFDDFNSLRINFFDFFYFLFDHYLFNDDLFLDYLGFCVNDFNNFFNNLGHLNDPLYCLDDGHRFLYDSLNDVMLNFNVIFDFSGIDILNYWHTFFYYFFDFDDLWDFNYFFNNLLDDYRDLYNFLNNFLSWNNFFVDDFDFMNLFFNMIHYPLYFDNFINFNNLLLEALHLMDFRNLFNHLDYLLYDNWHLHHLFNSISKGDNLINSSVDYHWLLQWDINFFLNLFDFFNFNNFFNYSINCYSLWYFDQFFNNLLHDFLNFHNFRHYFENFQYVVNFNNSHNLLSNHSHYAFIHLWDNTWFSFKFFHLFKKSFDQNSKMELYFSGFFTWISIYIFNFDDLRLIFHYLNNPINFIDFNTINDFLLEEFDDSFIKFSMQFWIFGK